MACRCVVLQASVRPVVLVSRPLSRASPIAWAGRSTRMSSPVSSRSHPLCAASVDEALEATQPPDEEALSEEPAAAESAEASTPSESTLPNPASYALNFLWLDKNIAVSVDQVFGETQRSPLTEYFFWPRKDAWEELKSALESRPWVSERDKVLLLNKTTEVINFWQDEEKKHTLQEAQEKFPDCKFQGT
ncbi:g8037 [Coccomyxa elongata]